MLPPVRRVITGQTSDNRHIFTHIENVEELDMGGGAKWYGVWGWDKKPELPFSPEGAYDPRSVFPAAEGMRINMVTFPAGFGTDKAAKAAPPPADQFLKYAAAVPTGGDISHDAGMHSTDSVDIGFVVSGELVLIQGDKTEQVLRPGDVLVQNGAFHAWQNRSDQPCMTCFVVLGASRNAQSAG